MKFETSKVIYNPAKEDITCLLGKSFYFTNTNLIALSNYVENERKDFAGVLVDVTETSPCFIIKQGGVNFCVDLIYPVGEPEGVSIPKYRPFNNVDELIQRWNFLNPCTRPAYTMPLIWVKHKDSDTVELITAFCKDGVEMGGSYMTWGFFFDAMVFLDNTPCGVEIKEEVE